MVACEQALCLGKKSEEREKGEGLIHGGAHFRNFAVLLGSLSNDGGGYVNENAIYYTFLPFTTELN